MPARFASLCLLFVLLFGFNIADAHADTLQDRLNQAQSAKNPEEALESLRQAIIILWAKLPLSAHNIHLLKELPNLHGEYRPRGRHPYKPDETLVIYMEPVGFKVREQEAMFNYHLQIDFSMRDAWGHVVGEQKGFSSLRGPAFSFPDRLPLVVSYDLLGLTAGEYVVETTLNDMLGHKSHTVSITIQVETR